MIGRGIAALAGAALAGAALARPAVHTAPPRLVVERVAMLMRHGVRPPTKAPPMTPAVAREPWPAWPVPPGWLTPHGAAAVRAIARSDRAVLAAQGVLPAAGCPAAAAISLASDSDERTIATGDAWLEGLAPGCRVGNDHRAQDEPDPLFRTAGEGATPFDPARANAAVAQALGPAGIGGAQAARRDALARIDRIFCGAARSGCGVTAQPSMIVAATPGHRPKLAGALDLGSTAAQILLLEYADGKPMAEVGWGRASAADVTAVGALHAAEFAILVRPPYLAAHNSAPIAARLLAALTDRAAGAPRLAVVIGHDTNVAALAGLLGLHWTVPGFATDDPAPGGALGLELLRDAAGARYVRAFYRAQSLAQLRRPAAPGTPAAPYRRILPIAGCAPAGAAGCPLAAFAALVRSRLGDAAVVLDAQAPAVAARGASPRSSQPPSAAGSALGVRPRGENR